MADALVKKRNLNAQREDKVKRHKEIHLQCKEEAWKTVSFTARKRDLLTP